MSSILFNHRQTLFVGVALVKRDPCTTLTFDCSLLFPTAVGRNLNRVKKRLKIHVCQKSIICLGGWGWVTPEAVNCLNQGHLRQMFYTTCYKPNYAFKLVLPEPVHCKLNLILDINFVYACICFERKVVKV